MPQKIHFSSSLEHRLYSAEFDDALVDQAHWKNPRYAGCKLTGKKINEYHGTDPFIDQLNTSSAEYLGKQVPSNTSAAGSITFDDTITHTGVIKNRFTLTVGSTVIQIKAGSSNNSSVSPGQFDANGSNVATLAANLKTVLDAKAISKNLDIQTGVDGTGLLSITCSIAAGVNGNGAITVQNRVGGSGNKMTDSTTISQTTGGSSATVWGGDISYGLNPVINKETTAIYIANTVVGGTENQSYATLEGHSYVGISKILLVNMQDNTVRIIDRETEPYDSFHRFITSDFPTGAKLNVKVLDPAIQSNLEGNYRCRMNKGWLLSSFKYLDYLNDNGLNIALSSIPHDTHNNPLELFDESDLVTAGFYATSFNQELNRLAFRFGIKEDQHTPSGPYFINNPGDSNTSGVNYQMPTVDFSPNYTGATIVPNKFTKQYYSGSLTFPSINTGGDGAFLSASRFILNKTVDFLTDNFETTELHLTINKGTIDFAPKFGDERSMGTFEVDRGFGASGFISNNDENEITAEPLLLPVGSLYGHNTPIHHILQLKGTSPFTPTTTPKFNSDPVCMIREESDDAFVAQFTHNRNTYFIGDEGIQNYPQYSGSAAFELSFLDKDHTLILNINKDEELFDGIGSKGIALISEHLHGTIKSNLEYYLEKAGVIDNSTNFHA